MKDFAPITIVGSAPDLLPVHPSVPAKNPAELLALARTKPVIDALDTNLTADVEKRKKVVAATGVKAQRGEAASARGVRL